MTQCKEYPNHKLIFLGDYFDYGNSLACVLDLFISLDRSAIFLLGNHEHEFFQFVSTYGTNQKDQRKILNHFKINHHHLQWLHETLVISYENQTTFFSHAGIDDLKKLEEQEDYHLLYSSFRENLDHVTQKRIVQGHIPMKKVCNFGNHYFIDTGCGLGGHLSALVYPEMEVLKSE